MKAEDIQEDRLGMVVRTAREWRGDPVTVAGWIAEAREGGVDSLRVMVGKEPSVEIWSRAAEVEKVRREECRRMLWATMGWRCECAALAGAGKRGVRCGGCGSKVDLRARAKLNL